MASVLKTDKPQGFVGSNPTSSANFRWVAESGLWRLTGNQKNGENRSKGSNPFSSANYV